MANMRDVAREANVALSTVSAVINGTKQVSPELRERVLKAIEKLNYRPNLLARALLADRSGLIAAFVPSVANPFFSDLLDAIEQVAYENEYSVFICTTHGLDERVRYYRERLLGLNIDGALVTLTYDIVASDLISQFSENGIPVVGVGGGRLVDGIDCFVPDDYQAGRDVGGYLYGIGHRRIGYIGPAPKESRTSSLRYTGLCRAAEERDGEEEMQVFLCPCGYTVDSVYQAMVQLLSSNANCTAIVCYNDVLASGVMETLHDQGFNIPEEISVVGFDDTVAIHSRPRLTTMSINRRQLAELATRRLFDRINDRAPEEPEHQRIPMQLVVRQSTKRRL